MWLWLYIIQQTILIHKQIRSCVLFNQYCDSFPVSKMSMSSYYTDGQSGDLHPISALRQQTRQGQNPPQQQQDQRSDFKWYADYLRNLRDELRASVQKQRSQSRNIPNGRSEGQHLQGEIQSLLSGNQWNAIQCRFKSTEGWNGCKSWSVKPEHRFGSWKRHPNEEPVSSMPIYGRFAIFSETTTGSPHISIGIQYAGLNRMPSSYSDPYNYVINRRRNTGSSCEFAASACGDGNSQNQNHKQSMKDFSRQQQIQPKAFSNSLSWNWTHTGASRELPMNAGQQKHGRDRRYGSTSAGSGFPSSLYSTNRSSFEHSKSSQLQQPSNQEPSSQSSTNRSSCEFDKISKFQQTSYQEPLPVDQDRPVFPAAAAGAE